MTGRVAGKVAIVCGAGQTAGTTIGNGRAAALLFAREGAQVLAVDRDEASVTQTCELIASEGFTASPLVADITDPDSLATIPAAAIRQWGSTYCTTTLVSAPATGPPSTCPSRPGTASSTST